MSNCKEIIEQLNSLSDDYANLINYVGQDEYYQKKQELLDTYFSKYNNGKEWYYKLKDLDECFTREQIHKFADIFQLFQTGDIYTFLSPDSEIRQLQKGRRCKYEKKGCVNGDSCRDHSIKHRITYVHNCGPVWVSYISDLINRLEPKKSYGEGFKRRKKHTRRRVKHKSKKRRRSRRTSKRKLK